MLPITPLRPHTPPPPADPGPVSSAAEGTARDDASHEGNIAEPCALPPDLEQIADSKRRHVEQTFLQQHAGPLIAPALADLSLFHPTLAKHLSDPGNFQRVNAALTQMQHQESDIENHPEQAKHYPLTRLRDILSSLVENGTPTHPRVLQAFNVTHSQGPKVNLQMTTQVLTHQWDGRPKKEWTVNPPRKWPAGETRFTPLDACIANLLVLRHERSSSMSDYPEILAISMTATEAAAMSELPQPARLPYLLEQTESGRTIARLVHEMAMRIDSMSEFPGLSAVKLCVSPANYAQRAHQEAWFSNYLADPERAKAVGFLLESGEVHIEHAEFNSARSGLFSAECVVSDRPRSKLHNHSLNAYSASSWILLDNGYHGLGAPYFLPDVVIAQYCQVSVTLGYANTLPSEIIFSPHSSTNKYSEDRARPWPHAEPQWPVRDVGPTSLDMARFARYLDASIPGKQLNLLLETLGLRITSVTACRPALFSPTPVRLTVAPRQEPATDSSPP